MAYDPELQLADFCVQVAIRARSSPPLRRSSAMLAAALARVTASPASMRSRVLGKFLVALSQDGGQVFGPTEIFALDAETCGMAAELMEGRRCGWWSQSEWDEVRRIIQSLEIDTSLG